MSATDALARAIADAYGWPRHLMPVDRKAAERILADPGPLFAALAEAGVLHVEKCCDQAWREMEAFGGTRIYTCDGPCERYQYRTEWTRHD